MKANVQTLSLAIASILAAGTVQAAGLDRSGQDVTAFLQDGTYAEFVYTYVDADVAGHDNGVPAGAATNNYVQGKATGKVTEDYDFFRFGIKTDVNDRFSVGVLYDEPFGASVHYQGDSNFVSAGGNATIAALTSGTALEAIQDTATAQAFAQSTASLIPTLTAGVGRLQQAIAATEAAGGDATALKTQLATVQGQLVQASTVATRLGAAVNAAKVTESQKGEGTNVEIRTNNVTALLGAKFGKNRNFQVYAGPAAQRLNGEVHLRGIAYQGAQGYDAKISTDTQVGWVAGVAYSKPEIALKAALTYRSEIEHESEISESFPALGAAGITTRDFKVTLPKSFNFDFQTGVNPTTLLTAKVRYVPWADFDIRPPTYGDATAITNNGNPLAIISYSKDQWSGELGLGKKLNDKVSVSGTVGYDSGAGNPASSLGPIKGYYSVGLGAKYNITPEWSISAGGKYLKFGDADANLPNGMTAGRFEKNDGYIAGVKLAYQAK